MIVENKNIRYMKLKELRTILKTQKYPKMAVEKALAIPQAQLRSEKLKNNDILPLIASYNPSYSNVFPDVREIIWKPPNLENFQNIR